MKIPIFIDTETTGIANCRLIELAWGTLGGEIHTIRVKPPVPITSEAQAIHGISETDVASLPEFCDHPRYAEIKALFESNCLIGHNVSFDVGVLAREGIVAKDTIDTKRIAQKLYKQLKSYRLQALREHLNLSVEGVAHSASGDVAVLMALSTRMTLDAAKL